MNYPGEFSPLFSDLCGLCVPSTLLRTCFARDNPSFGCGCAALGSLRLNPPLRHRLRAVRRADTQVRPYPTIFSMCPLWLNVFIWLYFAPLLARADASSSTRRANTFETSFRYAALACISDSASSSAAAAFATSLKMAAAGFLPINISVLGDRWGLEPVKTRVALSMVPSGRSEIVPATAASAKSPWRRLTS